MSDFCFMVICFIVTVLAIVGIGEISCWIIDGVNIFEIFGYFCMLILPGVLLVAWRNRNGAKGPHNERS